MKEYHSNYLGIVINNNDPEYRGRVQVFVPHIMPALYEGWNKDGNDINISCVGDNIENSLSSDIIERLQKILPWAEAASPIIGSSSPGGLLQSVGSAIESAASAIKNYFVQTPTSNPTESTGENGKLDTNTLTSIGNGHRLRPDAAEAYLSMVKAAQIDGITWTITDSYRTYETQVRLAQEKGLYSQGGLAATPGTSNHGWGTAVDLAGGANKTGTPQNNWLQANAGRFGFRTIPREPWHWEFKNAGTPPASPEQTSSTALQAAPNPLTEPQGPQGSQVQNAIEPDTSLEPMQAASGKATVSSIDTSNMSPAFKAQYDRVYAALEGTRFANMSKENAPKDGATYGVNNGTREEWAHLFTRLAAVETTFNPTKTSTYSGAPTSYEQAQSVGLYQLGKDRFKSGENWQDPNDNTGAFVRYAELLYYGKKYGGIDRIGSLGAGFGPISRIDKGTVERENEKQLLAENMASSERQIGSYTGTAISSSLASPSVVNKTDGYGKTIVKNTNDMAKGLFAFPNVGAMVWVFFREGNPLYPVYFAASYSSSEWQSAYRGSSLNASGTNTGNPSPDEIANSTNLNFNSAGGIESTEVTSVSDPTKSKKVLMIHGPDGSNRAFTPGYVQDYTRGSKRDQVDSNSFRIVGGYEEKWVEADSSYNVRGNNIIKVGKFDQEAIDAMQALSDFSNEINQSLKTQS